MPIKYKTKLTKVKITDLKKKLFDLLSECDVSFHEGEESDKTSFIYHGVKVTKYADGYSVKMYQQTVAKERYVEIDNIYLIHLLCESVPNEIETII